MSPETNGPAESVRGRGLVGGGPGGRSLPRGFLAPELCVVAAILVALVVGISLSGQAGSEEEREARDELGVHASPVEGIAFAPDGRTVASASRDGAVMIWNLATRRSRRVGARTPAGFSSVAFSPDGRVLVAGGLADGVTLLDPATGATLATLSPCNGAVRDVAFAPDGKTVASGGDDGVVRIWDVASGRQMRFLRGHDALITRLAFSPDGQSLASAGVDGEAIVWDLDQGRARERFQANIGSLASLTFTADGRSLALGGVGWITIRELATGRSRTWQSPQGRVTAVRFLPDGLGLASSGLDGSIAFWSVSPSEVHPQVTLKGHKGGVKAMAISPDGTTLISGGNDDAVKIWSLPRLLDRGETPASHEFSGEIKTT